MAELSAAAPPAPTVDIARWPSERPLLLLVWLSAIAMWITLAVTVIGIAYAALLGIFFLVAHLVFITHLRGNGVRLSPEQMPELYARVTALSRRVGLREVPEAYVVQAGGTLNALATRFLGANVIVLFSDLLDACGDNEDARDFIIAHELGHLHAGHLRLRWLLLPGLAMPFLGTGYSRACEYTCDRYGLAASDDDERALDGLCILAAGGEQGPRLNRRALVAQRAHLNTIAMKIGHWLSTHPPIAHRLAALQPSLASGPVGDRGAAVGAGLVIALTILVPIVATVLFARELWPQIQEALNAQQPGAAATVAADDDFNAAVESGILSLVAAAEAHRTERQSLPADADELYRVWAALNPDASAPLDPYDGQRFGYTLDGEDYYIWSVGPDPDDATDDLYYSSEAARAQ